MTFSEEVSALYGQYNNNIKLIRDDSTSELFGYMLRNPNNQVRETSIKKIQIGRFYVIKYAYNDNKLWCPILTIPPLINSNEQGILDKQLKIFNNKKIIYAVNFDYLPIRYKTILINAVVSSNIDRYEKNSDKITDGGDTKEEYNFRVDWIYNFLKVNGKKNYAITAYDILKIDRIFEISSTILARFVFLDTYYINNRLMYETLNNIQNQQLREEFSNKIKMFEEILKIYEKDVEKFYTSLRNFEKNLKLIEEI